MVSAASRSVRTRPESWGNRLGCSGGNWQFRGCVQAPITGLRCVCSVVLLISLQSRRRGRGQRRTTRLQSDCKGPRPLRRPLLLDGPLLLDNHAPAVLHFGEDLGHLLVVFMGIPEVFQLSIHQFHQSAELKDKSFELQTWVGEGAGGRVATRPRAERTGDSVFPCRTSVQPTSAIPAANCVASLTPSARPVSSPSQLLPPPSPLLPPSPSLLPPPSFLLPPPFFLLAP